MGLFTQVAASISLDFCSIHFGKVRYEDIDRRCAKSSSRYVGH